MYTGGARARLLLFHIYFLFRCPEIGVGDKHMLFDPNLVMSLVVHDNLEMIYDIDDTAVQYRAGV